MNIFEIFLWFIIYSFTGWLYESILCSVTGKKLVNRGFLNGPICPIYGVGAVTIVMIFGNYKESVISLFLASAVVTCTIEYLTSYVMEKAFHARWWDYSKHKFNINGRVCMRGFLVFGGFSVALVKWLHPLVDSKVEKYLSETQIIIISCILFAVMIMDLIVTVVHILQMNHRLEKIQNAYDEFKLQSKERCEEIKSNVKEQFENSKFYTEAIEKLVKIRHFQERRLWSAFPHMTSIKWKEALENIKNQLKK